MVLRSHTLAEVESGDVNPGVFGPPTPVTEGSGELFPSALRVVALPKKLQLGQVLHTQTQRD